MIGIDAVDIDRLRASFERAPAIEHRLFTHSERTYCRSRQDPVLHFAGTLAAKEAVIKARRLGPLMVWCRRIEIARSSDGVPCARIAGHASPIDVSISHDGPVAVAIAIAPASPAPVQPRATTRRALDGIGRDGLRPNEQLLRYLSPVSGRTSVGEALHHAELSVGGTDFP